MDSRATSPVFVTAARLAAILGRSVASVRQSLAEVPPASIEIVRGQKAPAYSYPDLPESIRADLLSLASRKGYQNPIALLNAPPVRWTPPASPSPSDYAYATKLQKAFAPFMEKERIDMADALAAYQRAFGHAVEARSWNALFEMIAGRDNGFNEWERLEIYLPKRIAAQHGKSSARQNFNHRESILGDAVNNIADKSNLTPDDRVNLWDSALRHHDDLAAQFPAQEKPARLSLLAWLYSALPTLAKSPHALRVAFDDKRRKWIDAGRKPSALADKRPINSGHKRGPEISQAVTDVIVAYGVLNCGQKAAPAWRAYLRGQIPNTAPEQALLDYYTSNPACKSYVPPRITEAVKYEIKAMKAIHHGPYQYGQTAHLVLDDSNIFAGDIWSSDDTTYPIYFIVPDGSGGWEMMRGQTLITADRRSRRILGAAIIPRPAYDSLNIRAHFVNTADTHGLPRKGVEWERGLWQKSKLVKGDPHADLVSPAEAELGLKEFGISFYHRHSPKAKIIERIIGALQDRSEGEPGYCGRNEQTERFERLYKLKLDVAACRVNPVGKFYTFSQWEARFLQLCAEYNAEPQDGLGGLSPDQAYEQFQNPDDPPIRFDDRVRYLLATHRRVVKVNDNGVCFTCGKRDFIYRNEHTGALKGQRVLIWFSPENPDVAHVTDLQRRNPFSVGLSQPVPSVNAPKELLAREMSRLRSHQEPVRARYKALKATFTPVFRANVPAPEVSELGQKFEEGAEAVREAQTATARKSRQIHRAGGNPGAVRNQDRWLRGNEIQQAALAKIIAKRDSIEENQP